MSRRFVDQLNDGDTLEDVYLVSEKQLRSNRNGNPYIQLDLRDRTGMINGRVWNAGDQLFRSFDLGDFLLVRGKVQLHQGALQVIVNGIEKVDAERVELTDFLPHTEQDVAKLLERARRLLFTMKNHHLRALVECYLGDEGFVRAFTQAPAGVRVHHAYVGGLLEHVVAMMELAERIAPLYVGLDRDLLLMGVFLHDSGKVRELSYGRLFGYTDEGQLIGHLAIGCEMLQEKIAQVPALTDEPFPRELLLRLKHMILSHHGELQYGSPKVPMTLESVALHYIDNLDTRMHIFQREIKEDRQTSSAWTVFNPALQRRIYKGGGERNGAEFTPGMESYD